MVAIVEAPAQVTAKPPVHSASSRSTEGTPPLNPPVATGGREAYIDAFRGFLMLCLISRGFGFIELKDVAWAKPIVAIFDHAAWAGMTPWDMIQPWFMFIVGVAMPFAFAKRSASGDSWVKQFGHALKRAGLLLLWAHIAMNVSGGKPGWELINVLAQIAFAYLIAFFVLGRHWTAQAGVAVALLVLHTAAHLWWRPGNVTAAWELDNNVGAYLDRVILGKNWSGGYATINFVTSAAGTIAGVMAGEFLRRRSSAAGESRDLVAGPPSREAAQVTARFLVAGIAMILLGIALAYWLDLVPLIKRIWTSSFALVSTGVSLLTLLAFYLVGRAWPNVKWGLFIVIGANPIFLYLANIIFGGHLRKLVGTYTTWAAAKLRGWKGCSQEAIEPWVRFTNAWGALLILIAIAYWLYRRKLFIRV